MIRKLKDYRYHILCWGLFIIYEVVVVGLASGGFGKPFDYIVHYPVNISLFYIHACIILPFSFGKGKGAYFWLPLMVVIEIGIYIYVNVALNYWSTGIFSQGNLNPFHGYNMTSLYRGIYFTGFATGYYYIRKYSADKNYRIESEKKILESELEQSRMREEIKDSRNAYLRAQINPHFLFNALNYIFIKFRHSDPNTASSILELSDIIRFAVDTDNGEDKIILKEEIEQVIKLIKLYSQIQTDQNNILLDISKNVNELTFIPLILLTLTENIFKHGNLAIKEGPAIIKIKRNREALFIQTSNIINTGINESGNNSGLENIVQRLAIAYGEKATFEKLVIQDIFIIKISVAINAL